MYSNLYSQYILTNQTKYYLLPHNVDITDLVNQYKLVTNKDIASQDTHHSIYGSYPRRDRIDQVYFIYDNNDPEYSDKYYVLRNYPENSESSKGLFAIIKTHSKRNRNKFSLTTEKINYDVQQYIYGTMVGLCLSVMLFGNNTILQISMIIPVIIALLGVIQTTKKVKEYKKREMAKEGVEIIGFRTIKNIDIETISKALDLGYEDRIRAIFHTPEEYLEKHLHTLKEEIDITYDYKAAQLNPSNYIENYSLQEIKTIKEIEESSQNKE